MSVTYLPAKKRLAEPPLSLQKAREMIASMCAGGS